MKLDHNSKQAQHVIKYSRALCNAENILPVDFFQRLQKLVNAEINRIESSCPNRNR